MAYRMLGSASEAQDAVQEAWIRLSRSDSAAVDNLGGWLTTVVARMALDMLRSRSSRREEPLEEFRPAPLVEARGAEAVAGTFSGRAQAARLALIDGRPGAVWSRGGKPQVVFRFTIDGDLIGGIEMIGDPDAISTLDLEMLETSSGS